MSKMRLSDPVRTHAGEVTTIASLADRGLITFIATKTETRKRLGERHERPLFLAEMADGGSWEIGKAAYESRTGQKVVIERKPAKKRSAWIW